MLLHLWVNTEISGDNKWWNQTKQQARHLAWHAEILTIRDNAIHFNRFTLNNLPIWKVSKNHKFHFSKFVKNNWYTTQNGELRGFIHKVKPKEFIHSLKSKKNTILHSPYWLLEQEDLYLCSVYTNLIHPILLRALLKL